MKIQKSARTIFKIVGIVLFLLLVFGKISPSSIFIYNRTASLPLGFYLIIPNHDYQPGDIVAFRCLANMEELAHSRGWLKQDELMLKKIGGVGGNQYEIRENDEFWVRGKYIGPVAQVDHEGRQMPSIGKGDFLIDDGYFLPVAENPRSFDGRYYGEVPIENIKYRLLPLINWN